MKIQCHHLRNVFLSLVLSIGCTKDNPPPPTIPELTTTAATAITSTSAASGGNISSDGGASIKTRGVCWSTSTNPNTTLSTKTSDGSTIGIFASSLTGLAAGTTYYVRAYATNSAGEAYGNEVSFTTPATSATLTTAVASSITATTATSGGNISNDGGASIANRGVCWSTSTKPDTSLSTKTSDGSGTGTFTSSLTGLKANTTYYIRAYATNRAGTMYGNELNFKTTATLATLTTTAASNITQTVATSGGNINSDGGAPITNRGVCWNTSTNPDTLLSTKTSDGSGTGSFTSRLSGLSANTTYYVRAYATNSEGTTYGNELSFTTPEAPKYKTFGLGFSPYIDGQNPDYGTHISEQQIVQLLQKISPYTNWIRTYGSADGLEKIGVNAHNMGLKVAAGAWLGRNMSANQVQIANLITQGKAGQIDIAIVGNEVLLRGDLNTDQLIGYINQVKAALPNIPVTTADDYQYFLSNPDLISALDVLFIHVHPYWKEVSINCATHFVDNTYNQVKAESQGKKVVIAESGWPSEGEANGFAVPSLANAATFFLNFASWARAKQVEYFYFSAFDESWKSEPHFVGPHWGLWNKNGGLLKQGMNRVFDNETVPGNWELDIAAILANPPSISFTHVPPLGSLENLEGTAKGVLSSEYSVAVYIYVNDKWWTKPTDVQRLTSLQCDGRFICDITTGGNDQDATEIRAYVVPAAYKPPLLLGESTIPVEVEQNAVAWTQKSR